jgi:hypothetical protein
MRLEERREVIARNWYEAIACSCYAAKSSREVRQDLEGLAGQAIDLLAAAPLDGSRAEEIGMALARLHYIQAEALGGTLEALGQQLKDGHTDEDADEYLSRLASLLGGIAAGFFREACRMVVGEQETIRAALVTEIEESGRAMLADDDGATPIRADIRQPEVILTHPEVSKLLDFDRPLGLLQVAILHYIVDHKGAAMVVRTFGSALAPGSLMAIAHSASECEVPERARLRELFGEASRTVSRSTGQIGRFFEGFELVEPGLVLTPLWRQEGPDDLLLAEPERAFTVAGVGRKP